jgi:hypothetical protein
LSFTFTFDDPGSYVLTVEPPPPDCAVNIAGGQEVLQVNLCKVAGLHEDAGFTQIQERVVAVADDFTIKARPTITKGFGGKLQPGNPASFFLGGKYFPRSDAEGNVYIAIDGFWFELEEVQWDPAGNAVAVRVPDSITGVMDQQTVVRIVTLPDLMVSNDWPVEFRAARETRTLTQNELEVVECSDNSNVDHCNDVSHVDSIHYFCGANDNASYSGCHYNAAGFADVGFDKYRIELKNGWVINTILFSAQGGSVSQTSGNPVDHSSWVEEIAWSAGWGEMAQYSGFVSIIGPRGIPHK